MGQGSTQACMGRSLRSWRGQLNWKWPPKSYPRSFPLRRQFWPGSLEFSLHCRPIFWQVYWQFLHPPHLANWKIQYKNWGKLKLSHSYFLWSDINCKHIYILLLIVYFNFHHINAIVTITSADISWWKMPLYNNDNLASQNHTVLRYLY